MTLGVPDEVRVRWTPRTTAELLAQQVEALSVWNDLRRSREQAASVAATSREVRAELARRMDVVRRSHAAVMQRTEQQLRDSERLLDGVAPRRAVVAHRNAWFRGKLAAGLTEAGVLVVAELDNGADAVGYTVAEQPDLLFVEDSLPMVPGEAVIRDVRELAPATLAAAQVGYEERIAAVLDAGAATVFRRQVPPADVVNELGLLLRTG